MNRYGVSASAGQKDGKRFVVWDRQERKAAAWCRTAAQALAKAKNMNRETR